MPTPDKTISDRWSELETTAERNAARIVTDAGAAPLEEVIRSASVDPITVDTSTATVQAAWHGRMVRFTQGCTVTVPELPARFSCGWHQEGEDPIAFEAGDGVTLQSLGDALESAGQFAMGGIAVFDESDVVGLYGALV